MYKIIDIKTGTQVGKPYKCRKLARQRANKLDLQYGAIRYVVRPVETKQQFDLATLRSATDKYLEYRRAEYNHHGAIHQTALYFRDALNMSLVEATQLARDAAQDG